MSKTGKNRILHFKLYYITIVSSRAHLCFGIGVVCRIVKVTDQDNMEDRIYGESSQKISHPSEKSSVMTC